MTITTPKRQKTKWYDMEDAPKDGSFFIAIDDYSGSLIFDMRYNEKYSEFMPEATRWSGDWSKWTYRPTLPGERT